MRAARPLDFIHEVGFADLPRPVVRQAERCILDLVGVAASGSRTNLARIAGNFAASHLASREGGARILFDGRRASPAGAAFAGASLIDSFDAHDGHALTKGHAGAAVFPALLAFIDAGAPVDGREFLTALVVGYEVAIRAGIALHAGAADYHTSGAWSALGCAALGARLLALSRVSTREALGIAEYNGPRSQMMRCIDHPSMVKDGSGWGAFAGVAAAFLAAEGFTGAPALTMEEARYADIWSDLGMRWRISELYFKPYPVCRWAQPAIEAVRTLIERHAIATHAIGGIEVRTFAEAARLKVAAPQTTEAAQYSLPFPVAAFAVRGRVGADEITGAGLADPEVLALARRISLTVEPGFSARFPMERLAQVAIRLEDGTCLTGEPTPARGDPGTPLSDDEITAKFRDCTAHLSKARRARIEAAIARLRDARSSPATLLDSLLGPVRETQSLRSLKGAIASA